MEDARKPKIVQAQDTTREASLAFTFLLVLDKARFINLLEDIENVYTQGEYSYPRNMTEAYKFW